MKVMSTEITSSRGMHSKQTAQEYVKKNNNEDDQKTTIRQENIEKVSGVFGDVRSQNLEHVHSHIHQCQAPLKISPR